VTGYPWHQGDVLHFDDLNAAFANSNTQSEAAQTQASAAQIATATLQQKLAPIAITLSFPGAINAGTYVLTGTAPYSFTINSIDASIGSVGGSIVLGVRNNGQLVGGISAVSVNTPNKANTLATGGLAIVAAGSTVDVVISNVIGSPVGGYFVLNAARN
jgi:hypothetical protein